MRCVTRVATLPGSSRERTGATTLLTVGNDPTARTPRLPDSGTLVRLTADRLYSSSVEGRLDAGDLGASSAVLMLLCEESILSRGTSQPCLILNKRSADVRQPGDLCFPGGGISPRMDSALSRLLRAPGSPLRRWPHYRRWVHEKRDPVLPLLTAAALREAYEEMRLNPWNTTFLGLLPPQGLRVMKRAIHPVAAWLRRPQAFVPNWEVERVVVLPIAGLLDPSRHGRLRVRYSSGDPPVQDRLREEFGCFDLDGEILWGLTYRMVEQFLELVLGFSLPALEVRKPYEMVLADDYFTRRRRRT